ncbi:Ovochymase-1 [Folsomia candida]|uniref:limulus clotting factor C n=1 Tax=Folsomia candida TaxID=158441 RepID=A0A226DGL6_FOLCA|nr:Ovochymase-1 [Folsomia candida]
MRNGSESFCHAGLCTWTMARFVMEKHGKFRTFKSRKTGSCSPKVLVTAIILVTFMVTDVFGYYMFPENSAECGKSIFYTHREARARLIDPSPRNEGRRRGRELFRMVTNDTTAGHRGASRSRSRSNRVNSRVMKWALNNNVSSDGNGPLGRIVGGQVSAPYAWPWQGHWCGGVLIGREWALTASHCLENKQFRLGQGTTWYVLAGEYDRTKTEGTEKMIGISRIFIHERFKEFDNDIALLKLSRPIDWTPTIAPVCLPNDDEATLQTLQGEIKCVSSGFGSQSIKGKLSSKMQQVWVNLTPQEKCSQMYRKAYNIGIRNFHICAGPVDEKTVKGTCVGDSGGPLMCNMKDGRWHLVGVTSFGSGCARAGYPDVFSRITYYLPWIRGKIKRYGTPFLDV